MPTLSRASIEGGRVLASGRLRVLRRLGEGGMGVVFEALDLERNVRVALKTMHSMNTQSLARFKREFRALQDVHHPNLVHLGELVSEDDVWFFTMELVDGGDLLEYVRVPGWVELPSTVAAATPSTSGEQLAIAPTERFSRSDEHVAFGARCDEGRLRSALRQLVSALSALHDAGVVHRDVKPSNIRVTNDGRVVLLDFGLVADSTSGGSQTGSQFVGTPAYMAPEQATNMPPRPEADFYSVGVLLYEALTGKLPFEGAALHVLIKKQHDVPATPSSLAPSVPPDLEALCMELLSAAPSERPDARKILGVLGDRMREKGEPRTQRSTAQAGVFVGRARELERLDHAYRKTRTGEPQAVVVQGESGLGKSCLLRHFCDGLVSDERDVLLLRGRCYERETVPYKAFDGVIDALASALSRMSVTDSRQYLPTRPGPLLQIFPVLRRWEPIAKALTSQPSAMDPLELRNRAFASLRELFTRIVNELAVVIVIDDIQWADADSLALLQELLRAPDAPPLLVLASMRGQGETADVLDDPSAVPSAVPGAPRSITGSRALRDVAKVAAAFPCALEIIDLGRLSNDEALSLAVTLLEKVAPTRTRHAGAIVAEASGHPFFIDALARYAAVSDADAIAAPRLEDALLFSMSHLEAPARALLELVAVAAVPITQQALVFASGEDARQFARDIGRLRASNLVSTTGVRATDTVEPYHDRVRAAAVANIGESRRRDLHRSLALALERTESRDAEALAAHWQGADVPDRASRFASEAADAAVLALAFDRAVRLYERAISLAAAADPSRGTLFEKLGNAFACAGRSAPAATAFREAAKGAKYADALDLHRRAADQLMRAGHFDEGLEATVQVLEAVGMKFPHRMFVAILWILLVRIYLRVRGFGFRQRDTSQLAAAEITRVDVCCSVAFSLAIGDTIRGSACQARHIVLALRCGEPYRVGRALAYEIGYLGLGGRSQWRRAMQVAALARGLCEQTKNAQLDALVTANEGLAHYTNGHFKKALVYFERSREIFVTKCTGSAWEIDTMQFFATSACAQLGMLRRMCEDAPRFLRDALDRGDVYGSVLLRVGFPNMRWLIRGDVTAARDEAADAMKQWSKRGFHLEHFYERMALVQADLYSGDASRAQERIVAAAPGLRSSLLMRVHSIRVLEQHLRARGALAAAAAASGSAQASLLADARRAERGLAAESTPWSMALAALARGGIEATAGRKDRAVRELEEATRSFEGTDMMLYAAAARHARARLVGGDEGKKLRDAAEDWMSREGVKDPARLVDVLAPGAYD